MNIVKVLFAAIVMIASASCETRAPELPVAENKKCFDCHLISAEDIFFEQDRKKYLHVEEQVPLHDLAIRYLGDQYRVVEIVGLNPDIFNKPDRWLFGQEDPRNWIKEPSWMYAVALPGETLRMPDDAYGYDIFSMSSWDTVISTVGRAHDYEYLVIDSDLEEGAVPSPVVSSKSEDNDFSDRQKEPRAFAGFSWFERIFLILVAIILAFLALALVQKIINAMRREGLAPVGGGSNSGNAASGSAKPHSDVDTPKQKVQASSNSNPAKDNGKETRRDESSSDVADSVVKILKQMQKKDGHYDVKINGSHIVHDSSDEETKEKESKE